MDLQRRHRGICTNGPDRDGLDLIQLSSHNSDGTKCGFFDIKIELADKLQLALREYIVREMSEMK